MGWLPIRSPLCLSLLLLICSYSTGLASPAIAAIAIPQNVFTAPVPKQPLPHLKPKPSSACLPISPSASFNSQQLDQQLQRYLRFLAQFGKPDILIVGSSRALQGIDPIVLQQTLASKGYPNLKIFNLGVNGATAQLVELLLREILSPNQLPRLLLWGDGARAFNSGRVDITYKRAIASQSYQLLTAGLRPTLPFQSPIVSCTPVSLPALSTGTMVNPTSFAISSFEPSSNPLSKRLYLYKEPLNLPIRVDSPAEREKLLIANRQELAGFQVVSEQFQPEKYFQHYPRVQGQYDADYRDFNLDGQQTEAFNKVVQLAQTHQIPVVFVNLPLTQTYLDETRTTSEKQFRAYLQRFSRTHALSVYDLSQRWLNQNTYFTDPSHLNRYGAAAVAAELGRSLVLPPAWFQGQR